MKTQEVRQAVTKDMKEKGFKVTQETTKAFMDSLEKVVDGVIESGDNVVVMGVKFGSKEQKGREGVITLGARQGETYRTEDKIVPTVKLTPSKKAQLTREK